MWREVAFEMLRSVWMTRWCGVFFLARQPPQPWNRPVLVKVVLARTLQQKQFWGRWEFAVVFFWCGVFFGLLPWLEDVSAVWKSKIEAVSDFWLFRHVSTSWLTFFFLVWMSSRTSSECWWTICALPVFLSISHFLTCNYLILILQFLEVLCFLNLDLVFSVR